MKIKVEFTVELTKEQLLKLHERALSSGYGYGDPTVNEAVRRLLTYKGKDVLMEIADSTVE